MNSRKDYEPVQLTETVNPDDLEETLIGAPPNSIAAANASVLMEVTAPASLPEGYEFHVTLNDNQKFLVKVPAGGVETGQKFHVPIPAAAGPAFPGFSVPVGHWRDDLTGIFNYGLCHPHVWASVGCTLVAAAQVIRRLNFTWRGTPAITSGASVQAFLIVLYITGFHWMMFAILYVAAFLLDPNDYSKDKPEDGWIEPTGLLLFIINMYNLMKFIYVGITVSLLFNLRKNVRSKYAIPGSEPEDCCCSLCCPCLVAGQLLRHTTDYDVYPSQLCTDTGLPKSAPSIV